MIDRLARSCRHFAAVSIPADFLHDRVFDPGMYVVRFGVIAGNVVSALLGFIWVRSALTQLQRGDGA